MRSDAERLNDILEAISLIQEHAAGRRDRFDDDVVLPTAVVKWIEQLGEAARGLSPELRSRHPEVDWAAIGSMRNRLTHGYFEIETDLVWAVVTDLVWAVVTDHLPALRRQAEDILRKLP